MTEKYDILLINAHQDSLGEGTRTKGINIGLALLATLLENKGFKVKTFRGFTHSVFEWAEGVMKEEGFKCAGFYCDNENIVHVGVLIRKFKDAWKVPVVAGGPQAASLDGKFLRSSGCDAIVRGEAEFSLPDVLAHFTGRGNGLENIEGITFLDGRGETVRTPDREPIADLDALPFPDYSFEKGSMEWHGFPVMTGRGCPYKCAFCFEATSGGRLRVRSVDNVIDEIRYQFDRMPGCRHVFFSDDTFTSDPRRVASLCEKLSKLRKERDFMWHCTGHVGPLFRHPEMLRAMAGAGLARIFLGVESGSDEVLKKYGKRSSVEMIEKVVAEALSAGVPQISGNIILGGYLTGAKLIEDEFRFAEKLIKMGPGRVEIVGTFLMPFPGTAIKLDPASFGLDIAPERELQTLTDMPLTETASMGWDELMTAGTGFNAGLHSAMKEIYERGEVPPETILRNYVLAVRYGIGSIWLTRIFAADRARDAYYRLKAAGMISSSEDISEQEIGSWRPMRVFDHCDTVSYNDGSAFALGVELSGFERELVALCSGKLTLSAVREAAMRKFPAGPFDDRDPSTGFRDAMLELERRGWIGYTRF